jgi:hypothetical protein
VLVFMPARVLSWSGIAQPEEIGVTQVSGMILAVAGVMIWALGQDVVEGSEPLLETIGRTLQLATSVSSTGNRATKPFISVLSLP